MRRGLMAWDSSEVPASALADRLAHLRCELALEGVDGFVAYTNIARSGAVWWLTGFTPYWNEGLLYAPADDEMIFATALSKRVAEWISSVMPAGKVTTTPRPSAFIGEHIARDGAKRIGIVELDDFPAGHAHAILQAAPGVELVDVTQAFARTRNASDAVERLLLTKADTLVQAACAAVDVSQAQARSFIAPAESVARLGGAEECFTLVACDLAAGRGFVRTEYMGSMGETFAARVSLAYKGAWTRHVRSFSKKEIVQEKFDKAHAALMSFTLQPGEALGDAVKRAFGAFGRIVNWGAEQPRGSYPLAPVANFADTAQGFTAAAPFVLEAELEIDGCRWIGARLIGL
jgi:hypothetical protein